MMIVGGIRKVATEIKKILGGKTLSEALLEKEEVGNKGVASGYCELDENTKIPANRLPFDPPINLKGSWNANTNTPTLSNGSGSQGDAYKVSVSGTTEIDGVSDWQIGDWIVRGVDTWIKLDNTDLVTSVNSKTGAVSLTTADVPASTDKNYCTDAQKTILTNQATMITLKACVSMLDDASIALPACPNGGLFKAWTEAEYMEVHIRADASIEYIRKTANCDTADTDGSLCVIDDGANAKIKNRRGSTKVVSYILEYGTTA